MASTLGAGTTCEARICEDISEIEWQNRFDGKGKWYVDDVNGKPLDPKLVREARKEEIIGACKHKV